MKRLAASLLSLGALALGGCVFQTPPTAKQIGSKPRVKVKFKLCETDREGDTICPKPGNFGADPPDGVTGDLLAALRVPKGTGAPRRFTERRGDFLSGAKRAKRFVRNGSYTRQLNRKAPKGRKFQWIGYRSTETNAATGDDGGAEGSIGRRGAYAVKLRAPRSMRRALRRGKSRRFKVAVVTGFYSSVADRIRCNSNPFEETRNDDNVLLGACINDPTRAKLARNWPDTVKLRP